jgi:hypothetical protein
MLILVLLLTSCVASIGGGLAVLGTTEGRIAGSHLRAVQTAYLGEAAARVAIDAIAQTASSSYWPSAGVIPIFSGGARLMAIAPGETIDLDARTAELNADAARQWSVGADTPRWRLAAWGVLPAMPAFRRAAVWIADDVMDGDGIPGEDSNGMLMIHVEAFGPGGASCLVTAHVQREIGAVRTVSWREE